MSSINSNPYLAAIAPEGGEKKQTINSVPYLIRLEGEDGLGVNKGYFYNGAFYKDEAHTELITPKEGQIFYDLTGKQVYIYDGESYRNIGETGDSDVVDIVNTYVDLQNYPTASLKDNAIIKVLADETHDGKIAYYRWSKGTATWAFIGAQGPYYTKAQTDELLTNKEDVKPYTSLVRNSEYLYTVTFDTLPTEGELEGGFGACSAFVRDGKLYRNLDWNYDENLSFHVITKNFEGMSFVGGLTNGNLDLEKIAQLPYRVVDGVNKNGIMVSTHVLYNDWNWAGTGSNSLMKLPFLVLENVKSMATIATDLGGILSNLYAPEAMLANEYLIQVLVTDGTTTYVLAPSTTTGNYELINATSNPKLTNFRWVSDATVVRTNLQTRPTGVERWNMIGNDTALEDLRFTLAYEAPNKLSEFIGIDGTTKDSTDAELTAIYNEAHAEYLDRKRDGKTWQTMHSVVYGANGIENLYVQENWDKDYAYVSRTELQEALKNAGGAKVLTSADYNYPVNNPTVVALWLLDDGFYVVGEAGLQYKIQAGDVNRTDGASFLVSSNSSWSGGRRYIELRYNQLRINSASVPVGGIAFSIKNDGSGYEHQSYLDEKAYNGLDKTYSSTPLSAYQGKVLKDTIDTRVPEPTAYDFNKFLKGDGTWAEVGGAKVLTPIDYNYPANNPTSTALWLLPDGLYVKRSDSGTVQITTTTNAVNGLYLVSSTSVDANKSIVSFGWQPYGTGNGVAEYWMVGNNGASFDNRAVNIISDREVKDNLTTDYGRYPLNARQGKILKDLVDTKASKDLIDSLDATPTESTVGVLGQIKSVVAAGSVSAYLLTAIDDTDPTDIKYTWEKLSTSSDTPTNEATVDPLLNAMVVPEGTDVGDEELDMFGLTSEVEEDILRI